MKATDHRATEAFARQYSEAGYSIIPLKPASKQPDLSSWKAYQTRRLTAEELVGFFGGEPNGRGIGIVTGQVSGALLVLDFDDPRAFRYCFTEWSVMAKQNAVVETGRGVHLYVRLKGGGKVPNTTFRRRGSERTYLPVDLKGEGGYVVAPPSVHPSGKVYSYIGEGRDPFEDTREKLLDVLKLRSEEWPFVETILPAWNEGARNDLALGIAKILRFERGFTEERTLDVVRRICSVAGDLEVQSRLRTVRDTIAKGPERTAALKFLGEELYGRLRALLPAPRQQGQRRPADDERPRFESFVELPDGRIAEEVETAAGAQFLVYDPRGGTATFAPEIQTEGQRLLPLPLPRDPKQPTRKIVILPDATEEYGTLSALLGEMERLALKVYDPGKDLPVLKLWIAGALTSWIVGPVFGDSPERFAAIFPALGPSESGKGRLLTVARAFFYRPFYFFKTIRTPSLFRALSGWGDATLILNEADLKDTGEAAEFIEYLNSRADGSPITRYSADKDANQYFSSFGSTVLALRQPYSDDGFSSRSVPLHTETTSRDLDLITPEEWWVEAAAVQRKLLLFRLRTIARIRRGELTLATKVGLPVRSHRVKEIFLALASVARAEDPELLEQFVPVAHELERRLIVNRGSSKDGLILNAVYGFLSDPEWAPLPEGAAFRLEREYTRARRGAAGEADEPEVTHELLTLRRVGDSLAGAFSQSEIARVWREFGQGTLDRARVDGRRVHGVLLFTDPERLDKEFRRFVVDAVSQAQRFQRPAHQHTLEGGEGG
ncbi:MAG TPA: bifunctional DNA primase/polymerase [Thermoplasmata archaeon]|nr:bifunctional DNA primase/polymerase [Thermoplasmata archaeon]